MNIGSSHNSDIIKLVDSESGNILCTLEGSSVFSATPSLRIPMNKFNPDNIEKVIFNPPATIAIFKDGSKSVVKAKDEDGFDPEVGFAMVMMKQMFGSRNGYKKFIEKWNYDNSDSKLNINNLKDKNIAVHCKTRKLTNEFLSEAKAKGYDTQDIEWDRYGSKTCLNIEDNLVYYSSFDFYREEKFKIVEFKGWD